MYNNLVILYHLVTVCKITYSLTRVWDLPVYIFKALRYLEDILFSLPVDNNRTCEQQLLNVALTDINLSYI